MEFIHHPYPTNALKIEGELYKYLFKVRRIKQDEPVYVRTLKDDILYLYRIEEVTKKEAILTLEESKPFPVLSDKNLHIGWCLIDPKSIEKTLASLNEMGVSRISFILCDRSQNNFKLNFERLEKILINSSQQCGRSNMITLDTYSSIDTFLSDFPDTLFLDFGGSHEGESTHVIIGPEGGLSERERALSDKTLSFSTPLILKSESAALALASKVLL